MRSDTFKQGQPDVYKIKVHIFAREYKAKVSLDALLKPSCFDVVVTCVKNSR